MKKNTYSIDHESKTIILTKAYAQKANTPGTKEFRELATLYKTFNDYTITKRTAAKNPDKETHNGLTIDQMERFINMAYNKPEEALKEFETVKEYYKDTKGYYGKVKAWFLKKYPKYQEMDFTKKLDDPKSDDQNTDNQNTDNQTPADQAAEA